jgi:hypothetical protein
MITEKVSRYTAAAVQDKHKRCKVRWSEGLQVLDTAVIREVHGGIYPYTDVV